MSRIDLQHVIDLEPLAATAGRMRRTRSIFGRAAVASAGCHVLSAVGQGTTPVPDLTATAIVQYGFPSRFDGRKQALRPYCGGDAATEADQEYRHLFSQRRTGYRTSRALSVGTASVGKNSSSMAATTCDTSIKIACLRPARMRRAELFMGLCPNTRAGAQSPARQWRPGSALAKAASF